MRTNPLFDFSHLSVAERIQLAEDLWESIEPTSEELPLTEAQAVVLDQRLEEARRDPAAAVPIDEALARLYARFGADMPRDERGG
jgi:putative addiction module component (TIGR02574 family)